MPECIFRYEMEGKDIKLNDELASPRDAFNITIEDFNDGHYPGGTTVQTKIARYNDKHASNFISVFDNLIPTTWCDRGYEYAVSKNRPWGAYVTMVDALDTNLLEEDLWSSGKFEAAIALSAVRALLINKGASTIGDDLHRLHGTAVWCLTSGYNDEVRYHIDYAELYRYETNIIYPPVYGGTCHLAPIRSNEDMIGGAFVANTLGLKHYRRIGYKSKLVTKEEFTKDLESSDWISIPYRYNRGILCDGDFPHLATDITHIRPELKRVILGFNCFTKELAECNLRAPEHSEAFNRTIKLYQKMAALGVPITSNNLEQQNEENDNNKMNSNSSKDKQRPKSAITVKEIMKNPALAKMLVMAAKNVKKDREKQQKQSSQENEKS